MYEHNSLNVYQNNSLQWNIYENFTKNIIEANNSFYVSVGTCVNVLS